MLAPTCNGAHGLFNYAVTLDQVRSFVLSGGMAPRQASVKSQDGMLVTGSPLTICNGCHFGGRDAKEGPLNRAFPHSSVTDAPAPIWIQVVGFGNLALQHATRMPGKVGRPDCQRAGSYLGIASFADIPMSDVTPDVRCQNVKRPSSRQRMRRGYMRSECRTSPAGRRCSHDLDSYACIIARPGT